MVQSSFSGPAASATDDAIEELETQRTIGLTRMEPADPADTGAPDQSSSSSENTLRYEVEIGSMSQGVEGGQGVIEGSVEITEYVNDDYITNVVVTCSVIVESETSLQVIEDRLLVSTREAFKRIAELSDADLRAYLDTTKRDQDTAYQ